MLPLRLKVERTNIKKENVHVHIERGKQSYKGRRQTATGKGPIMMRMNTKRQEEVGRDQEVGTCMAMIEVERHSNQKWEWNEQERYFFLDRELPYPFFFPYAYGFIPDTLAEDGDALDVVVVSSRLPLVRGSRWKVVPIAMLWMEDEKGLDHKLIAVPEEEIREWTCHQEKTALEDIEWFFTNYKTKSPGKWSRCQGVIKGQEVGRVLLTCRERWETNQNEKIDRQIEKEKASTLHRKGK